MSCLRCAHGAGTGPEKLGSCVQDLPTTVFARDGVDAVRTAQGTRLGIFD